jgi:hypothetical protein
VGSRKRVIGRWCTNGGHTRGSRKEGPPRGVHDVECRCGFRNIRPPWYWPQGPSPTAFPHLGSSLGNPTLNSTKGLLERCMPVPQKMSFPQGGSARELPQEWFSKGIPNGDRPFDHEVGFPKGSPIVSKMAVQRKVTFRVSRIHP